MQVGTFSNDGLGFGIAFTLTDNFSNPAQRIQDSFGKLKGEARSLQDSINNSFASMQAGISMVATGIGLASPIGFGIKVAGEFESMEIGLRTLLKSNTEATRVMANVMADAAATPFQTKELLMVNKALIATGLSADQARQDTLSLANAIAGTGGGNDELGRMAYNLQQIRNNGKATSVDIKQFGIAGIPIYRLLADTLGINVEKTKDLEVTYEVLMHAFSGAAKQGGMFENALANMSKSIEGKFSTVMDEFTFSIKAFGESLMEFVHPAIDLVTKGLRALSDFMSTRVGKLVAQIVGISIALASLTVILVGLKMILGSVLTMLTVTFGAYFLPIVLGVLALVSAFALVNNSIDAFNALLAGTEERATGFTGFLQDLGGVMRGLWEIWTTFNDLGQSRMGEDVANQLRKMGLYELTVNIGSWLVRIKTFFMGMFEVFSSVIDTLGTIVKAVWDVIKPVLEFTGIIDKNTTSLEAWLLAGKAFAILITAVMIPAAIALAIALIEPFLTIVAIGAVLYGLYHIGKFVFGGIQVLLGVLIAGLSVVARLIGEISGNDGLKSLGQSMTDYGESLINRGVNKLTFGYTNLNENVDNSAKVGLPSKSAGVTSKYTAVAPNQAPAVGPLANPTQASAQEFTANVNLMLDGKVIANSVTKHQTTQANRSRQ